MYPRIVKHIRGFLGKRALTRRWRLKKAASRKSDVLRRCALLTFTSM
jgi:hypothetical protein